MPGLGKFLTKWEATAPLSYSEIHTAAEVDVALGQMFHSKDVQRG
jgi:hypothetical protein